MKVNHKHNNTVGAEHRRPTARGVEILYPSTGPRGEMNNWVPRNIWEDRVGGERGRGRKRHR